METTQTGYTLERWIAVLLFLLFFLPFVANADELLQPGMYHDEEVPPRLAGNDWLAMTCDEVRCALVPASVHIRMPSEPNVGGDYREVVTSTPFMNTYFLVRGSRLTAGPVTAADVENPDFDLNAVTKTTLGVTKYTLRFRCSDQLNEFDMMPCALVLSDGNREQEIATIDTVYDAGRRVFGGHGFPGVMFAGDLDGDGELDLLIDISDDDNSHEPTLYLSSAATSGKLVRKVASFSSVGC